MGVFKAGLIEILDKLVTEAIFEFAESLNQQPESLLDKTINQLSEIIHDKNSDAVELLEESNKNILQEINDTNQKIEELEKDEPKLLREYIIWELVDENMSRQQAEAFVKTIENVPEIMLGEDKLDYLKSQFLKTYNRQNDYDYSETEIEDLDIRIDPKNNDGINTCCENGPYPSA